MEVFAITKNVPMSAQKMREVVRQIQGLPALRAEAVLKVVPRKGARIVAKTLKSALANAEQLRDDWTETKVRQEITNLQGQVENTRNHKRRNKLAHRLAQYEGYLHSRSRLAPAALVIKEALAQTATSLKRFTPKARGSAGPIIKRRCHVKITLSDE